VLVAIAIPVFTSQLEKSREATDLANIRSAYAEVVTEYLTDSSKGHSMTVAAQQGKTSWQNKDNGKLITQVDGTEKTVNVPAKVKPSTYKVKITKSGTVSVE